VDDASIKLAFHGSGKVTLRQLLAPQAPLHQRIAACIGPEGGFTESELEVMVGAGFSIVRLGPFTLRTETAAIAALAAIAEYC
jgi:16S rRNA (uracil1498-N3)-methyltransferase